MSESHGDEARAVEAALHATYEIPDGAATDAAFRSVTGRAAGAAGQRTKLRLLSAAAVVLLIAGLGLALSRSGSDDGRTEVVAAVDALRGTTLRVRITTDDLPPEQGLLSFDPDGLDLRVTSNGFGAIRVLFVDGAAYYLGPDQDIWVRQALPDGFTTEDVFGFDLRPLVDFDPAPFVPSPDPPAEPGVTEYVDGPRRVGVGPDGLVRFLVLRSMAGTVVRVDVLEHDVGVPITAPTAQVVDAPILVSAFIPTPECRALRTELTEGGDEAMALRFRGECLDETALVPESVGKEFVDGLVAGDIDGALATFTDQGGTANFIADALRDDLVRCGGPADASLVSVRFRPAGLTNSEPEFEITVAIRYRDGGTAEFRLSISAIDGTVAGTGSNTSGTC